LGGSIPSSPSRRDLLLLLRYGAAGLVNSLLGFAVIVLCMSALGMPPPLANAAGFAAGYLSGYLLHRSFTFRSSVPHGRGLARWLAVTAFGYAANLAVLMWLVALGTDLLLSQALAVACYVAISFILGRLFVFGAENEKGEA
jgi:putative flippase GtrA